MLEYILKGAEMSRNIKKSLKYLKKIVFLHIYLFIVKVQLFRIWSYPKVKYFSKI
jgi:hypothetical protein